MFVRNSRLQDSVATCVRLLADAFNGVWLISTEMSVLDKIWISCKDKDNTSLLIFRYFNRFL